MRSRRIVAVILALSVVGSVVLSRFLDNFFYSLAWAILGKHQVTEADMIDYVLAHSISFLLTLAVFTGGYFILRHEIERAHGTSQPVPSTHPSPGSHRVMVGWTHRLRAKTRGVPMLPILGMVAGGLLFLGCAALFLANQSSSNAEIREALKRYVLPRHLTEEQIATVAGYLAQHEPQQVKFVVLKSSEEASSYRADFQKALERGRWRVVSIDYAVDMQEGVRLEYAQTLQSSQTPPDPAHPTPLAILQEAFAQARIPLTGTGGSGGGNIKENSLTISISHRRMDDGDLVGRRLMRERALKILQERDE
jgi:hypothetical protein